MDVLETLIDLYNLYSHSRDDYGMKQAAEKLGDLVFTNDDTFLNGLPLFLDYVETIVKAMNLLEKVNREDSLQKMKDYLQRSVEPEILYYMNPSALMHKVSIFMGILLDQRTSRCYEIAVLVGKNSLNFIPADIRIPSIVKDNFHFILYALGHSYYKLGNYTEGTLYYQIFMSLPAPKNTKHEFIAFVELILMSEGFRQRVALIPQAF